MEHAQVTGMLLLGLLIFANGNDLIRWLGNFNVGIVSLIET